MDLLQLIEQLKAKYSDPLDAPQLIAWEMHVHELLIAEGVADNHAVIKLLESLRAEVEKIEDVLLTATSAQVPDMWRDTFIREKQLYNRVISYFDTKNKRKELEKELSNNI